MNNDKTLQYMDKQIMDLSNSHLTNTDFIDLMKNKDDIIPSYDFMPIRPAGGSSSPPPPATRSVDFGEDPPLRTWSSFDSKASASAIRNFSSADADEPSKFTLGKGRNQKLVEASLDVPVNASPDVSLISEIDRTIKKHADNLMHAIDGVSARLTQLETRTRNLEHLVDDLKMSVENTHESTDGKMRQLENSLREVLSSVNLIKDKQEIAEAQLQMAKHYLPQVENQNTSHTKSNQLTATPAQQFSNNSTSLPPPNAPPTPPHQDYQTQLLPKLPNQFPQNHVTPIAQQDPYFPRNSLTPENTTEQYQLPPPQLPQHPPLPHHSQHPPPPNQYLPPHQSLYQPPPPPSRHQPEEITYSPSQVYPPDIHQSPPTGVPKPPSQQFYGPALSAYEPQSSRPGYSGSFVPSSGPLDPAYTYGSSGSSYGSGSPLKQQSVGQSSGSGYQQLPTARILPQALPAASGSGNKVPIDDVVDKVTNMGFSRDQVRATVRKLTENGQAVDLNIVLDKLMNDGDGQGPRGWYGR